MATENSSARTSALRVYHSTTARAAAAIDAEGFRDGRGNYLTELVWAGVWIASRPVDENETFGKDEPLTEVFAIDVDGEAIAEFEWIEDGPRSHREWLVPSSVLNAFPRRRLSEREQLALLGG